MNSSSLSVASALAASTVLFFHFDFIHGARNWRQGEVGAVAMGLHCAPRNKREIAKFWRMICPSESRDVLASRESANHPPHLGIAMRFAL